MRTIDPPLPEGGLWQRLTALYDAVAAAAAADMEAGGVPTVLSGDCLVSLGAVAGAQRAGLDPAIVWFDAHGDVHTAESSTSGYLGGMSLRLVMGAHPEWAAQPLGMRPIPAQRAVLVDARDLDPAEADYLAADGPARYGVEDVGPAVLPDGPLILHVDLDVVDAGELSGMIFPVPGGPSSDAVLGAAQRVLATGRVVALDVACPWYPARDASEADRRAAVLGRLTALT
ncbi:arginase [Murinocardiopsis flavida]|uniref:Arginase n=1 Tax=Murinocardiopsis flavida TaxID=645275 RepID=A0A2P8DSQ3_9ACTN|nr:arginase [Murinocardiopsis flavida]